MKISAIQTHVQWENIVANLNHFSKKIDQCKTSDIIILPEMFTTGFSLNVKTLATTMSGPTIQWMKSHAFEKDSLIIGSVIMEENGKYFNRCLSVFPNGEVFYYDKKHLFSYGNENTVFSDGNESTIITYKNWRIKTLVCYDLRFPVWSRNTDDYDLLIYVASWPNTRIKAWQQLLIARAIENQCYVVGVNRTGEDGNKLKYNGCSSIVDHTGEILHTSENDTILEETLDREKCLSYRQAFPFLQDKDNFRFIS